MLLLPRALLLAAGSFDDFLDAAADRGEPVLVEFFAPWCGTCRMVAPEVQRAAEIARALALPVALASVDVDAQAALAERFGVTSYPTFLLFRAGASGAAEPFPMLSVGEAYVAGLGKLLGLGEAADIVPAKLYDGAAAEDAALQLASWLFWRGANEGRIATTLVLFEPPAGAAADPAADAAARALFDAVARELLRNPNFRFAVARGAFVVEDFEAAPDRASIVLFKDHDEGRAEFPAARAAGGAARAAELADWVKAQAVPLAVQVTHKNLQRYRKNVELLALFFVTDAQADSRATRARLLARLAEAAYALEARGAVRRGNFTLGLANGGKYVSWLHHYGLDGSRLPALVLERPASEELFAAGGSGGGSDDIATAGACDAAALAVHNAELLALDTGARAVELAGFCSGNASASVVGADGEAATGAGAGAPATAEAVAAGTGALTWVDVPVARLVDWLEAAILRGAGRVSDVGVEPAPVRAGGERIAAAGDAIFEEKLAE